MLEVFERSGEIALRDLNIAYVGVAHGEIALPSFIRWVLSRKWYYYGLSAAVDAQRLRQAALSERDVALPIQSPIADAFGVFARSFQRRLLEGRLGLVRAPGILSGAGVIVPGFGVVRVEVRGALVIGYGLGHVGPPGERGDIPRRSRRLLAPLHPPLGLGLVLRFLGVDVLLEQPLGLAGVAGFKPLQRALAAIVVAGGQRAGGFLQRRQFAPPLVLAERLAALLLDLRQILLGRLAQLLVASAVALQRFQFAAKGRRARIGGASLARKAGLGRAAPDQHLRYLREDALGGFLDHGLGDAVEDLVVMDVRRAR